MDDGTVIITILYLRTKILVIEYEYINPWFMSFGSHLNEHLLQLVFVIWEFKTRKLKFMPNRLILFQCLTYD